MEPITLCGAVILAVGLWVEFEPMFRKVTKAISSSSIVTALTAAPVVQRPLYVKYLAGSGN